MIRFLETKRIPVAVYVANSTRFTELRRQRYRHLNGFHARCLITARSNYASAVLALAILSVRLTDCLSHCLSVTRVLCDEMKEHRAEILTSHERLFNLVFWVQKRLVGDAPFQLKFALKLTTPFEKRRLRPISAYNVSTVRTSEKCSIIANRKLTMRFPTSYR